MTNYDSQQPVGSQQLSSEGLVALAKQYWWAILLVLALLWYLRSRKTQKKPSEEQ
jgi:hypothetical protein